MTRGALLFAYNSPKFNYYKMAEYTAKRINHFLNIPVTLVTDEDSLPDNPKYNFDRIIINEPDKTNKRDWGIWINKGRYQAFEFSPYDETLLLDTDYVVNSDKILKTFILPTDFCCHENTSLLMHEGYNCEVISNHSFNSLWATVVMFRKSKKVKQIFDSMKMIQNNFHHYANLHGFIPTVYRNDYSITLALRIVNGHFLPKENIIPWNLVHIGKNTIVYKNKADELDTEFTILFDNWKKGKIKKEYITIKNSDFHMLNKENFMDIVS